MSQRIEQLSREALDYAAEQYGPQRTGEKVWDPLTYERKLAELIVKECLHIVDDEGAGEGGGIRAMIRIQEEFGVEE